MLGLFLIWQRKQSCRPSWQLCYGRLWISEGYDIIKLPLGSFKNNLTFLCKNIVTAQSSAPRGFVTPGLVRKTSRMLDRIPNNLPKTPGYKPGWSRLSSYKISKYNVVSEQHLWCGPNDTNGVIQVVAVSIPFEAITYRHKRLLSWLSSIWINERAPENYESRNKPLHADHY